jgi:hypothetical protein
LSSWLLLWDANGAIIGTLLLRLRSMSIRMMQVTSDRNLRGSSFELMALSYRPECAISTVSDEAAGQWCLTGFAMESKLVNWAT